MDRQITNKTLRDEFAIAALQAIVASGRIKTGTPNAEIAMTSYGMADAMLEARGLIATLKTTPPEALNNTIRGETHSSRTEAPHTKTKVPDP